MEDDEYIQLAAHCLALEKREHDVINTAVQNAMTEVFSQMFQK